MGDTGRVVAGDSTLQVNDTIVAAGYVLHVAEAAAGSSLKVGEKVTIRVDYERRGQLVPNHTFTHVLNYALREVLGDHVDQKGSIVLPDK